jgi:hypothetical protein
MTLPLHLKNGVEGEIGVLKPNGCVYNLCPIFNFWSHLKFYSYLYYICVLMDNSSKQLKFVLHVSYETDKL